MMLATFLMCIRHRYKQHPYIAPQELARCMYSACKVAQLSWPWVLSMRRKGI